MKKVVLKNLVNYTGKRLCWSLFLIELQAFRLQHRCLPVKFVRLLRTPILKNIWSGWFYELFMIFICGYQMYLESINFFIIKVTYESNLMLSKRKVHNFKLVMCNSELLIIIQTRHGKRLVNS